MFLCLMSNWDFGTNELISSIAALLTFTAICVSLYLSQKSKPLKFKVLYKKFNKKAFEKNFDHSIDILNNGHTKFTCSCAGYLIGKKFYFYDKVAVSKKLDNAIYEQTPFSGRSKITTDSTCLPTYVQEGDILRIRLWPTKFDFSDITKNKKVYVFLLINGKIYKYYIGINFFSFSEIIKIYMGDRNVKSKNINDYYL